MDHRKLLTELNNKTVDKIYEVDFNTEREDDNYLPWLFYITFFEFEKFIEIEGDFDGDHIRFKFYSVSEFDQIIKKNNFSNEPDLWKVYEVENNATLGQLINQKIKYCEYGIDKDEYFINGEKCYGEKDLLKFIRFYFKNSFLTIYEWGGLLVSDNPNVKFHFEVTFDRYKTL
jgi:hypothetical protein